MNIEGTTGYPTQSSLQLPAESLYNRYTVGDGYMTRDSNESREFPRLPLDVQVNYKENAFAKSKDISSGGICLITEEALEMGKIYKLAFSFPGETELLESLGKAMWSKSASEHLHETGLSFWDIAKELQKKIDNYFTIA